MMFRDVHAVHHVRATKRRLLAAAVAALAGGALVVTLRSAPPAHADTSPQGNTPATVAANVLKTVQQNGVVWAQGVVRNAIYATGRFTETWPGGAAHTAANQTPRNNLLAYNIHDGSLYASQQTLNAQGLGMAVSPDTSRLYVVGDFTRVDGLVRNHIAAFNTYTGKLDLNFHPSVSGRVSSVVTNGSTVYFGGNFFSVNGVARTRLAAARASDGALLPWAPTADDNSVNAMVMSPDNSRVILGGRFTTLNHVAASGMGAVTASSPARVEPWSINTQITNGGTKCGISSLVSDGTYIYGSGYAYGCGNFEGTFAAQPNTGTTVWINDCHGDTYSVAPFDRVLYSVGHAHDCSAVGQFPDTTNPRIAHHALAWTIAPYRTNTGPDSYGWNYNGVRDSLLLHWFPTLTIGKITMQNQAAWSVVRNGDYISVGGEFPSVNGFQQTGLVRFAISSLASNAQGPLPSSSLKPVLTRTGANTVNVAWGATWDRDNVYQAYRVFRDNGTVPVCYTVRQSNFWTLPNLTCNNTGVPAGTHTYYVQVKDHFGNTTVGAKTSITI